MDAFGDIVWNFYGATETGIVTLASPADLRQSPGTIGPALYGNDIRLVGDDGRERGRERQRWSVPQRAGRTAR
jgi:fatty-acyl-CoA synthase